MRTAAGSTLLHGAWRQAGGQPRKLGNLEADEDYLPPKKIWAKAKVQGAAKRFEKQADWQQCKLDRSFWRQSLEVSIGQSLEVSIGCRSVRKRFALSTYV